MVFVLVESRVAGGVRGAASAPRKILRRGSASASAGSLDRVPRYAAALAGIGGRRRVAKNHNLSSRQEDPSWINKWRW